MGGGGFSGAKRLGEGRVHRCYLERIHELVHTFLLDTDAAGGI